MRRPLAEDLWVAVLALVWIFGCGFLAYAVTKAWMMFLVILFP